MRLIMYSFLLGIAFLNFPGCLSNIKQEVSPKEGIATTEIVTVSVSEKDMSQTKTDLMKLAASLNFMNWYRGQTVGIEPYAMTFNLAATTNTVKLDHVIGSPYFWISFWNGYEQHKNTNVASNKLDATVIKNIFTKYKAIQDTESDTNKKGLKVFVTSILAFAEEDSSSGLTAAITDLKLGANSTTPVNHFESLILYGLKYSIDKILQSCNVSIKSDTRDFCFKNGIFTETGTLKSGFKTTAELTTVAGEAIRGLTILKESFNKVLKSPTGATAIAAKAEHIKKIDSFVSLLTSTFGVTNIYAIHTNTTGNTYVLTSEEKTNPSDQNEILEGGSSSFLNSIRDSGGTTNGVIINLITASK